MGPLRLRNIVQRLANLAQYCGTRIVHDFPPSLASGRAVDGP